MDNAFPIQAAHFLVKMPHKTDAQVITEHTADTMNSYEFTRKNTHRPTYNTTASAVKQCEWVITIINRHMLKKIVQAKKSA